MNETVPSPTARPASTPSGESWTVRKATVEDAPAIAQALHSMLMELGGSSPAVDELCEAARELSDDERLGVLIVAQANAGGANAGEARAGEASAGELIGVLGASWQMAVRVPGRYGLIQELWVSPAWRSRRVGAELLDSLCELALQLGIARLEVGLPSERFAQLAATEAFYVSNDFAPIGTRMRRLL